LSVGDEGDLDAAPNLTLDGLGEETKLAVSLFADAAKKHRHKLNYDLLKYKLASNALGVASWDMQIEDSDPLSNTVKTIWSEDVLKMLGFDKNDEFPNLLKTLKDRIHPFDRKSADNCFADHLNDLSGNTPFDCEFRLLMKNGTYRHFRCFGTTQRNNTGHPIRISGALQDIEEKHLAQVKRTQALITMETILNGLDAMIYVTVPKTGEILFMNELMKHNYGLSDDVIGQICYEVLQSNMTERCSFCPCFELDENPSGTVIWEEPSTLTMRLYRNVDRYIDWHDGTKVHVQYSTDITETTQASLTLQSALHARDTDQVTGIHNRRFFDENMPRNILSLSRSLSPLSLMMVDIDCFKNYNDTYGHPKGDECLRLVATALADSLSRESDFVARYGGEEFVVVLPDTDERGASLIAEKLLRNIRALGIEHRSSTVDEYITVSIGGTTAIPEHTHSAQDYVTRADEMLYKSKQSGRNKFTFDSI